MPRFLRVLAWFCLAAVFLAACNLPQAPTVDPNAIKTEAAQTIEAGLTQTALLTPSVTPSPPATLTPVPPTETPTPVNSPSPTPICDLAQYVADVSVADGTPFLANQAFTKTWRLKNIGVCTWTSAYQVIFDNGEAMSGPANQPLAGSVAPGQTVDISLNLKAPASLGSYRGYWKLRNPSGVLIPIVSGYQNAAFFVDIKVVAPDPTATPTLVPGFTLVPLKPIIPVFPLFPSSTPTPKFLIVPILPLITLGP